MIHLQSGLWRDAEDTGVMWDGPTIKHRDPELASYKSVLTWLIITMFIREPCMICSGSWGGAVRAMEMRGGIRLTVLEPV